MDLHDQLGGFPGRFWTGKRFSWTFKNREKVLLYREQVVLEPIGMDQHSLWNMDMIPGLEWLELTMTQGILGFLNLFQV
jgi:hypothetical protein